MDIHGGIFVRINNDGEEKLKQFLENEDNKNLKVELNRIIFLPDHPFAMLAIYNNSDDSPPSWFDSEDSSLLAELSEVFDDIIAFYAVDEYLEYQHWGKNQLFRMFSYSDVCWDKVSGTPDAWEEENIFSDEKLEKRLQDLRDYYQLTEEREQIIREVWAKKTIRSESEEPQISSDVIIRAIQNFYDLDVLFKENLNSNQPKDYYE